MTQTHNLLLYKHTTRMSESDCEIGSFILITYSIVKFNIKSENTHGIGRKENP